MKNRIREISSTRVRYGYRRITTLPQREGWRVNHKRVYRLYREEGLQMRHKVPRRRVAAKLRDDRTEATRPNECWSMDFMSDELYNGQRIRLLTLVDNFTRESLAIEVNSHLGGQVVAERLDWIAQERGRPKKIRVDNGRSLHPRNLTSGLTWIR